MRFWGRIIGVFFTACLVASSAGDYLATVGPAPLQFAPPPPSPSPLVWRLPLPPVNADAAAEEKKTDSSAIASSAASKAAQTNAPVAVVMAPSVGAPVPSAVQANAPVAAIAPPPAGTPAAVNGAETAVRSQSPSPMLLPGAPVGTGESPVTAFALMKYFKSDKTKTGTTDVIVPVPVGFVPPMPMPMPAKPASSSATYLSP